MELEFFNACKQGNLDNVKKFIKLNVDINWQHPSYMETPLMIVCWQNQFDIEHLLK